MSETVAIRYLVTKGWLMLGDGWFTLHGIYNKPVCVDTAYYLQRNIDQGLI